MSGYPADELRRQWGIESQGFVVEKPFTPEELIRKVAEVLSTATLAIPATHGDR
jgi:hypothetical protein